MGIFHHLETQYLRVRQVFINLHKAAALYRPEEKKSKNQFNLGYNLRVGELQGRCGLNSGTSHKHRCWFYLTFNFFCILVNFINPEDLNPSNHVFFFFYFQTATYCEPVCRFHILCIKIFNAL